MIISPEKLQSIRVNNPNKTVAFCSGVFDLTHAGHVLFFEDCKKHADILVVGVSGGLSVSNRKEPGRPVMNKYVRIKMVDSLKPVDYCFINEPSPDGDPFFSTKKALRELKPDLYVINKDAFDIPAREAMAAELGVKLLVLERWCLPEFEKISTTKLIEKIKGV